MEIKNNSKLFENSLIIYPDLKQILSLNELYKSDKTNHLKEKFTWENFSPEFCNVLELINSNKSDIFACHNLFETIRANKNTFLYSAFDYLNFLKIEKFQTEERNLDSILSDFENFVKENISKSSFTIEEIYLTILIILYVFLQEAVTGSSFMFIKVSEKTDFKKDLHKFTENNFSALEKNISEKLQKEIYEFLTVNGEVPFNNIKLVFLFVVCYKMLIKSEVFECFEVNKIYKSRVLFLQDKMLKDQAWLIKEQIFKSLNTFDLRYLKSIYENNAEENFDAKDFDILQGLLNLEKSFICLRYYQYKECQVLIEDAKALFGLNINLTGRLGRKTKYQVFDVPLLVIESNSSTLEKSKELVPEIREKKQKHINQNETETTSESNSRNNSNINLENNNTNINNTYNNDIIEKSQIEQTSDIPEEEAPTGVPKQVMLASENPLLETPNITDTNKIQASSLSLHDQIYITALLNSYKHSYPDEDLIREVVLTYVNKSIEKSYDWLVFSKLLLHRSLAEEKKTKTIERSLLQIESLCLQYNDRLPNSFSRMKYIFTVDYPFIWKLKKIYAEMFMSYGAFITAFDLFEELGMFEECVNCLYLAGKNERAMKFAEDIIKKYEDPGIYCVLGEINRKEEYFHKALEVSKGKYTRAYRCLGKLKMAENKYFFYLIKIYIFFGFLFFYNILKFIELKKLFNILRKRWSLILYFQIFGSI